MTEDPPAAYPHATFRAMGSEVSLIIASDDRPRAADTIAGGRARIAELEHCLSRFRPDSELMRLNARAGAWTGVSGDLAAVLGVALRAARRTGGLCTPTCLNALLAAGYDRDFAEIGRTAELRGGQPVPRSHSGTCRSQSRPPHVTWRGLRARPRVHRGVRSWRSVQLRGFDDGSWRARLPRGVGLDLAGVAKGWTADAIADMLVSAGPCLVDIGGDLAARGSPDGRNGWLVGIADPRQPGRDVALVDLRDAGIATSGIDYRRWVSQGRPQHHLIDARTGAPAVTDVLSASVIAPTTAEAEVDAKLLVMLGAGGARHYLVRHRRAGLIVRQDGRVYVSPRWSRYAYVQ